MWKAKKCCFCCCRYITISHIFILLFIIVDHNHPQPLHLLHPLLQNKQSWRAKEVISPTFAPILSFVRSSSAPASIFCNSRGGQNVNNKYRYKNVIEDECSTLGTKTGLQSRIDDLKCWYFGFNIDPGFQFIAHPYSLLGLLLASQPANLLSHRSIKDQPSSSPSSSWTNARFKNRVAGKCVVVISYMFAVTRREI